MIALLASTGNVTIDAVYPNPATAGDVGEYVVLSVPEESSSSLKAPLRLGDGEDQVMLPTPVPSGRIAVAWDVTQVRNRTDLPIIAVNGSLALSNGGERLFLQRGNSTVSSLQYPAAPEAEVYRNGTWTPLGRTDFEPMRATDVEVTAFVLPDDPTPIDAFLDSADERLLVGGYTFTDPSVTDHLVAAQRRGVDVQVLLEGRPVGGHTTQAARQATRLQRSGIDVRFLGGDRARYAFHHAKYAVADERLLVTSENWKPGGTGGNGSRGWGLVIEDPKLANATAALFQADTGWKDTRTWTETRPDELQPGSPDNATYPQRFDPRRARANATTLFVAPDNADDHLQALLRSANRSIWIEQVSIQPDGTLANETVAAARRGVSVRILLSGEWYVEEENRRFAASLRNRAAREDLPITVRLVEPRSRFEHVHAKGVVVDHQSVVVGSLNWNEHARHENREVIVQVDDAAVAAYYERVFLADWRGAAWRIQWELVGALLLVLVGAGWAAWQFGTFEGPD